MLKHAITISCYLKVTLLALFCITKPRKTLEVDLTHVQKTGTAQLSYSAAIFQLFFFLIHNKPYTWRQVNRQILLHITWFFQTKTYASLVSALPKSISDKRAAKKRKSLIKIVFSEVGATFRHTFPCGELQCFSRGDPIDLCVNTRIRSLTTHSLILIVHKKYPERSLPFGRASRVREICRGYKKTKNNKSIIK